ncbi:ThiF family adenylyltransferase [Bacillus sp. FJAT-45350]|uniref:ThiF family adenylyltransferase n=1 Tax=Bacillus sp. FJAT-45350 TaxID=2011014 RepID=UPI000BB950A5|nr:ThiF family adenylyltransferase [Bacillus sp. FJAT-45350]
MDQRYSRQILFSHIGKDGQEKLNQSKVLIVGMGSLGIVLANHLVRAGVGSIRIVDKDTLRPETPAQPNLFNREKITVQKVQTVIQSLKIVNSSIIIEGIYKELTESNIKEVCDGIDLVFNGTNNSEVCSLLSTYCYNNALPFIYGTVKGSTGRQVTFIPEQTACLECLRLHSIFNDVSMDLFGPVTDIIASYQAIEGMKYLIGKKDALRRTILTIDGWENSVKEVERPKPNEKCLLCQCYNKRNKRSLQ